MPDSKKSIIIIGAGLAGLTAARTLKKEGYAIKVLEARDRVGGRNKAHILPDGTVLEMGGQWIGPGQTRMYDLCEELGLEVYPTYNTGKNVVYFGGKRALMGSGKDDAPKLNIFTLLELARAFKKLEKYSKSINLKQPWQHPKAKEWDGQSFETWIKQNLYTKQAKNYFRIVAEAVFSAEATDFSFLHFLFYIKAGAGLASLIGVEGGAQKDRVVGGTQQISIKLAEILGEDVLLNCPVDRVEQLEEGVKVWSGQQSWTAQKVIVALPPTLAGRLNYTPPLPALRDQLTQRIPAGSVIKMMVIYKTPFWRKMGLTGQAVSDIGPVKITFDNSPQDEHIGVLLGFMEANDGRKATEWTEAEREQKTIGCLATYFGEQAKDYTSYIEQDWMAEAYTRGCYGGHFTPGVWTAFGNKLKAPIGNIHWAGAETAEEWNGYMEGAVRSGERVAAEIRK